MSYSIAELVEGGPAAVALSYSTATEAELIGAIQGWITTRGWILHDDNPNGDASSARVFKAPLVGGTGAVSHFKYLYLWIKPTRLIVRVYELWDAGTHTGTNLAPNNRNAAGTDVGEEALAPVLALSTFGTLWMFASPRYFGVKNVSSYMVGCFERERAFHNDTFGLGLPPFGFLSGQDGSGARFTYPRLYDGSTGWTGANAASSLALPELYVIGSIANTPLPTSVANNANNAFSGRQIPCSIVSIYGSGSSGVVGATYGRIYGLKGMSTSVAQGDTINLLCDSAGFLASGGSPLTHIAMTQYTNLRLLLPVS